MFSRAPLVRFTRRPPAPASTARRDPAAGDILRRLEEAELEIARTIESLDQIAALLRGDGPAPVPAPQPVPESPGLRRSVPPR